MPKFPGIIHSKLPDTGTTIFTVMTKLANEEKAINLSQGFPDFDCPDKIKERTNHYMSNGYNQYAPMQGVPKLREAIADKVERLYSAQYDPDTEINVTAGATQAIYTALTAMIREGDEVIVFEPAYDSYVPAIELCGGIPIFVQLKAPDYHINWKEVQKLVSRRTKAIIINTPHNPTGSIMNAGDMQQLEKLTKGTDIVIISDEVYEHIIFDGYEHQSIARYPKLAERSFVVSSFGKTFHNTGWKIGYILAPQNLMEEFRKVHQFNVFTVNNPMQHAIADFMNDSFHWYADLAKFYQEKRDFFNKCIEGSRFTFTPSAGTYFQLLRYKDISDEKDTDFVVRLTKETKVASIPISVFYHEGIDDKFIRFCFCKGYETLEQAAELLRKV